MSRQVAHPMPEPRPARHLRTPSHMAIPASHATTRSERYALGPGADLPVARVVAVLLILLPIAAVWFLISIQPRTGQAPESQTIAALDPRSLLTDNTTHFLPTPVAALPAESNAGPPAPAADEQTTASAAQIERVKVANTGGAGAILRADPPRGRQV